MSDPSPDAAAELDLAQLREQAQAFGMNLVAAVDREDFDACQPAGRRASERAPWCGQILVLAAGGTALWEQMSAAECRDPDAQRKPRPGLHPVDAWSRQGALELREVLARHGVRSEISSPDEKGALNFGQLGEAAGFGTISPIIGILLNPEFGPWVSLRAALLIEGHPFPTAQRSTFQPCTTCAKPCVHACPVQTLDGHGGFALERCAEHRLGGGCHDGCDVRRSCPVGAGHRYGAAEESFRHAYSLFSMRKYFGRGLWRYVPRFLRQRL